MEGLTMKFRHGSSLNLYMFALVAVTLSGCAGVNFYSDSALKEPTGIPIYGSKPYVLVARSKAKDKPVDISIQYITDRSQVIYAKPTSGFGSSDLKITLDHGQLTQFGQITDTKIPELLNAVGGLLTSRATGIKTLAEADELKIKASGGTTQAAKIPDKETQEKIKSLLKDMSDQKANLDNLIKSEGDVVKIVNQLLQNFVDAFDVPEKIGLLSTYGDQLIAAAKEFDSLPEPPAAASPRTTALQVVTTLKPKLQEIVTKITPDPVSNVADFELYEIVQDSNGGVSLRLVK